MHDSLESVLIWYVFFPSMTRHFLRIGSSKLFTRTANFKIRAHIPLTHSNQVMNNFFSTGPRAKARVYANNIAYNLNIYLFAYKLIRQYAQRSRNERGRPRERNYPVKMESIFAYQSNSLSVLKRTNTIRFLHKNHSKLTSMRSIFSKNYAIHLADKLIEIHSFQLNERRE